MKGEHGLKLKSVLRKAVRVGVREANRILRDEPYQQARNSCVDGSQRRPCLPCAETCTFGGCRGKHEGWSETNQDPGFLSIWPWQNCNVEKRQVAELSPRS